MRCSQCAAHSFSISGCDQLWEREIMEHREDEKSGRLNAEGVPARKAYVPPRLRVYGDVATLTRALGNKSMKADGGSGMNSKTA
jgi:hypothetical protein